MTDTKAVTYRDAGVDIDAGDALVEMLQKANPKIGGFGAFLKIPKGYKDPRLVLSTDGVGTKLLVAEELKTFHTIGIDLVAMVVNDILTTGARPLSFLDYYAVDRLDANHSRDVIRGILEGCAQADCELSGGETAELPGVYPKGGFDLAGFGVGVVEKSAILDGSKVRSGDIVLGLPSAGLHSNGYSLARRVLLDGPKALKGAPRQAALEALLVPTIIYVKPVLKLLKKVPVKALAHITGGGLPGNLPRVLPKGCEAVLDPARWQRPPIFDHIQQTGPVALPEMYRVFNMGIGMCVVVAKEDAAQAIKVLRRQMVNALEIGTIRKGTAGVVIEGVDV